MEVCQQLRETLRKEGNYLENLEYLPSTGETLEPTLKDRSWSVDKKIEEA